MRKFFVFVMVLVSFLCFSCSKASYAKKVLTVWDYTDESDIFMKSAIEQYCKINPDVEIEFCKIDKDSMISDIIELSKTKQAPDLFVASNDKVSVLVNEKIVIPAVNQDLIATQTVKSCFAALKSGDTLYGYPLSTETYALLYNKKYVPEYEVPSSWDQLSLFVKNFNGRNQGLQGFLMPVDGYYTVLFTTGKGNRLFGPNGNNAKVPNMCTGEALHGMDFFKSLRTYIDIPAETLTPSYCLDMFASGKAAMIIADPSALKKLEGLAIDYDVASLPILGAGSNPAVSFCRTKGLFVSTSSRHPKTAADFAEFMISPSIQQLRYDFTGEFSCIQSAVVGGKHTLGFVRQLQYSFPIPSIPEIERYWPAMNEASANIWNGAGFEAEMKKCNQKILGK